MPKLLETIDVNDMAEAFDLHPQKTETIYPIRESEAGSCAVYAYNLESKKSTLLFEEKKDGMDNKVIHSLFYDKSGAKIFVQLNEVTYVYDREAKEKKVLTDFSEHPSYFNPFLFHNCMSFDRSRIMCCNIDGIKVIDTTDLSEVLHIPYSDPLTYRHAVMSKSGAYLMMYLEGPQKGDRAMQLWEVDYGRPNYEWKIEAKSEADQRIAKDLQEMSFSPDDTQLYLSGGFGEGPIIVDVKNGKYIHGFEDPLKKRQYGTCFSTAFSHDGKWLVVGGYMGYIYLIDVETKKVIEEINTENKRTYHAVFSDDDTLLVTGGDGGKICIYEMK